MRKIIFLLVALVLLVSACKPKVVEKVIYQEPEKIMIEYYAEINGALPSYAPIPGVETEGDWGKYVEKLYEARVPYVDIVPTVAVYEGGGTEQLSVRIAAGRYPTVYEAYGGRIFSYSPMFLDLPKPDAPFAPGTLDACTVNGKLVAYPIGFWPGWSYANVTLMKAAGCAIPTGTQWNTDAATLCAKKLYDYGAYLFQPFALKQSGQHQHWIMMNGGAEMFEAGNCAHTTWGEGTYTERYLDWLKSLLPYYENNPTNFDSEEWYKLFISGKTALGWWDESYFQQSVEDGTLKEVPELKILAMPHLPDVEATRISSIVATAVAVFEPAVKDDERLKEEAIKFALWLTGPEVNYDYHWLGNPSARQDVWKGNIPPEVLKDMQYGDFNQGFNCGKFNEARSIWAEEMQAFWLDQKTARQAMDSFVARYDEILR